MDPAGTESSCGQEPSRRQTASRLLLRMPPQLCRCHFNTGAFCSLVSFAVWHLSSFHLILIQPTKRGFLNPQICSEGAVRAVKHCPDLSRTQECTFHRSEIKAVTAGLFHHFPLVPAETFLSCFLLLETGGESIGFAYLQFCWFVTFL